MASSKSSPKIKYIVDAHALIWFLGNHQALGTKASLVLNDPESELILPAIAMAEACWAVERSRTSIQSVHDLIAAINADPRVVVVALDQTIVEECTSLVKISEMHDRQIVATALLLEKEGGEVAVLTKDPNIVDSGLVSVVW